MTAGPGAGHPDHTTGPHDNDPQAGTAQVPGGPVGRTGPETGHPDRATAPRGDGPGSGPVPRAFVRPGGEAVSPGTASGAVGRGAGVDSGLLSPVRAGTPVEAVTSDEAWLAAMVEFEGALADAQTELGAVPRGVGDAIRAAGAGGGLDPVALARRGREAANPVVFFVARLTELVAAADPEAARHVHAGSTSQDVLDSAAVLVARRALELLHGDLGRIRTALAALALAHRDTPAAARTLTQHAVPTTVGLRAASWLTLAADAQDRVGALLARGLPVSMGGAAGTLAAYHDQLRAAGAAGPHPELRLVELVATRLGLVAPEVPWHAVRTPVAELGAVLSLAAGALGKFAADVLVLTRTEIGEVVEPAVAGRGQSSAMPQKRNPVLSTLVASAARQVPVYALVLQQSLVAEDERSAGAWHAEWEPLRQCLRLTGGAAHTAAELAEGLAVSVERVRANTALTGGGLVAERLSVALAAELGRTRAKAVVTRAVRGTEDGTPLVDALRSALAAAGRADEVALAPGELLDPAGYLGAAGPLVDRAVRRAAATPPDPGPAGPVPKEQHEPHEQQEQHEQHEQHPAHVSEDDEDSETADDDQ
ncbi:class-II fumarase/aspartase family protein [Streptomyces qinzhouensis]|uniref:Adenylosuccinate lyase family protein n=1 Tax=Streptomyces qinzhouensis TaxID=2599401 RepID=A0A5B8IES0_9ACTN|nr:adenylosuccinate lyase family protein [Streptomyces qinzhouensis]QDY77058.1 adenylosuccinate lyase family protein [Streptomyces qinzhouensis]